MAKRTLSKMPMEPETQKPQLLSSPPFERERDRERERERERAPLKVIAVAAANYVAAGTRHFGINCSTCFVTVVTCSHKQLQWLSPCIVHPTLVTQLVKIAYCECAHTRTISTRQTWHLLVCVRECVLLTLRVRT